MDTKTPNHLYPLFITSRLSEVKAFYTTRLGFTATFDLPTYLQIRCSQEEGPELCFMLPDAFPDGLARPEFGGAGVIVSVPTPDADAKHEELLSHDVRTSGKPEDKPWGWRSFQVTDPIGVVLDFFHVLERSDS